MLKWVLEDSRKDTRYGGQENFEEAEPVWVSSVWEERREAVSKKGRDSSMAS
jgi:hypothetical protein